MITKLGRLGPIHEEWTPPSATATAAELVTALAAHDHAALGAVHAELAEAVTELHGRGSRSGPAWTVDDPLVALVRAAAVLARRRTTAVSPAAARVIVELRRSVRPLLTDGRNSPSQSSASWRRT